MLSVGAFEVLRVAVNLARERQIQKLTEIEAMLKQAFPGRHADVVAALDKWAAHIQTHGYSA